MNQVVISTLSTLALFAGMLLCIELGWRLGQRRRAADPHSQTAGTGPIEGALFGLLGLLLAFTFSGAMERFDGRRQLIVKEANAIGTAWLRLDLIPGGAQPSIRNMFRQYLEFRIETFRALPDEKLSRESYDKAVELQGQIWGYAIAASGATPSTMSLVLGALNDMFDVTVERESSRQRHPPLVIYGLLFVVALVSALFAGFGMAEGRRQWLHTLAFAAVIAGAIFVILDIEYPRQGFIRVDDADETLVEVRRSMK